jgi:hypothetical protein
LDDAIVLSELVEEFNWDASIIADPIQRPPALRSTIEIGQRFNRVGRMFIDRIWLRRHIRALHLLCPFRSLDFLDSDRYGVLFRLERRD